MKMVRTAGIEPALPYGKQILSLQRLPVSPRPHSKKGWPNSIDVTSVNREPSNVEALAHFLARFEIGNALGWHVHGFPGARIAPDTRVALAGGESTETAQLDSPTFGKLLGNRIEEAVDQAFDVFGRKFRIINCDLLNKFGSDHEGIPPKGH